MRASRVAAQRLRSLAARSAAEQEKATETAAPGAGLLLARQDPEHVESPDALRAKYALLHA